MPILTNGAGNFSVWAHRFYEFRSYRTQLAPTSGAMGYGVPAAVAAKILYPGGARRRDGGRRRLSDDRAGARDRRPARCGHRHPRRQQRHVRDDPDASGAALPGTCLRNRPRQPRFRGAGTFLRSPRRRGRAHRGIRRGVRGCPHVRSAVPDRAACRSGGPDAATDPHRDTRSRRRPGCPPRRISQTLDPNP